MGSTGGQREKEGKDRNGKFRRGKGGFESNIEWLNIQDATFLKIVAVFARERLNTKCLAKLVLEEQ